MRYFRSAVMALAVLAALVAAGGQTPPFSAGPTTTSQPVADSDGDGVPDPVDPQARQPGEDFCPSPAEDPDGVGSSRTP